MGDHMCQMGVCTRPITVPVTWKATAIVITLALAKIKITLAWTLFLCQVKVLSCLDFFLLCSTYLENILESVDQY